MDQASHIKDLIARISLKERSAFNELYLNTSAKLFGVCLRILKDRNEAEDALQEIYIRIWQRASSYRPQQYSPMSWLIAVARNHAIDRLRARKPVSVELDDVPSLKSEEPGPETSAILASEARVMSECLNELEQDKAEAVCRAYIEGYSYEELASHYSVPLNTMRTWLRRSLIKLRACLER